MGPPRTNTVALLHEKNQELKAYAARTSLIQGRLTATQDALDALQISHDEELRAEQTANHKLQQQLTSYYKFLKSAYREKDDLRNAVVSFLQRVEEPHTAWPRSQLHTSSLLEPADPKLLMHRNQDDSNDFNQRLMNYAASMIENLVHERNLAREAHQSLFVDARAQIAALEAELARRDLELEHCITHCVECANFRRAGTQNKLEPLTPMDPSTLSRIFQKTSTRHRILELGNQHLERQWEEFRESTTVPPSTAQLQDSDDANRERHSEVSAEVLDDSDPTVRMPPTDRSVVLPSENISHSSKLSAQMDEDIRKLGITVQTFAFERDQLQRMIAEHTAVSGSEEPLADLETKSPSIKPPYSDSSDKGSVPQEQHRIEAAYAATLRREKALIEENLNLVDSLRSLQTSNVPDDAEEDLKAPSPELVPECPPSSDPPQLLDIDDTEVSMDLATPLLPTTFLIDSPNPSHVTSSLLGQEQAPLFLRPEELSIPSEAGNNDSGAVADRVASENAVNELANLMLDLERTKLKD
ncbi:hypothetical protein J3R30DRAFT_3699454 [Lentinula aciculospora]|uniref:Uncharacterized protein n=1 Tax=Lentinula aciculospora TaxID=153920 RepID=A0A9W9AHQ6_9AGAR|nr:hypothetical protein J3R30DRAFT_3699454 [Lentinula aciculospora]